MLNLFPECVAKGSRFTLRAWGTGGGTEFAGRSFGVRNRLRQDQVMAHRPNYGGNCKNGHF